MASLFDIGKNWSSYVKGGMSSRAKSPPAEPATYTTPPFDPAAQYQAMFGNRRAPVAATVGPDTGPRAGVWMAGGNPGAYSRLTQDGDIDVGISPSRGLSMGVVGPQGLTDALMPWFQSRQRGHHRR